MSRSDSLGALPAPATSNRFLHRHEALRGYHLLTPMLVVLALAILIPFGLLIKMSFWSMSGYDLVRTPSLGNYAATLEQPMYGALLSRSLMVAAIATGVTVILSDPVAFHVHRHKMVWITLLTLPFWTSFLLRIFAWRVVLGNEGALNSSLMSLGLIWAPLQTFLYRKTAVAIALALSSLILIASVALVFPSLWFARMGRIATSLVSR